MFPAIDSGESRHALAANVMHFARLLRGAGLRLGPDRVVDCVQALQLSGCNRREDWYWTMSAVFLSKEEQRPIFDQAFRIFWRDPKLVEKMMNALLPKTYGRAGKPEQEQSQRLSDALFDQKKAEQELKEQEIEMDARLTFSTREVLQRMDFDTMSAAELAEAKKMLRGLRLPLPMIRTRRHELNARGKRINLRATLRESLRDGGNVIPLVREAPTRIHPPLVVLCDISGSMNPYARMFLHFLHAITNDRDRVSVFVFGTRLTNVTRQLKHRDVDVAMTRVADAIKDWSGGTRIGTCLHDFNWRWARRSLGQNACLLLVTDGLDREAGEGLSEEMERLHMACKHLIWMNPLLRYEKFEAKPAGVRAMLPYVDRFLPVHNLKSLIDLARIMREPAGRAVRPASRHAAQRIH